MKFKIHRTGNGDNVLEVVLYSDACMLLLLELVYCCLSIHPLTLVLFAAMEFSPKNLMSSISLCALRCFVREVSRYGTAGRQAE